MVNPPIIRMSMTEISSFSYLTSKKKSTMDDIFIKIAKLKYVLKF